MFFVALVFYLSIQWSTSVYNDPLGSASRHCPCDGVELPYSVTSFELHDVTGFDLFLDSSVDTGLLRPLFLSPVSGADVQHIRARVL